MKKFTLILAFIISLPVLAQETIEKSLGEFSTVKVYDLINLNMIQSNENKVVISGRNKNDVEILNKNGKLNLEKNRVSGTKIWDKTEIQKLLSNRNTNLSKKIV